MNEAVVSSEGVPLPPWTEDARAYILKVLDFLGRSGWEVSVVFCGDPFIQELNRRYRGIDEPTDILSFPSGGSLADREASRYLAGDLVISLETLAENARYFKVSEDEELRRLLIHGILHLDGMDHATNDAAEPMLLLQEEILKGL